jgi:hypothetical protein
MVIAERYKLIFHWEGLSYEGDIAYFKKAAFTGPVLRNTARIIPNDFIELDFTVQNMQNNIFLPNHYYIAKLGWVDVVYQGWGVELTGCSLTHNKTGSLKELKDGMKFFVDCARHEHNTHHKFLVYPAWVVNSVGEELKK